MLKLSPKAGNISLECKKRGETPKTWAGEMLDGRGLVLGPDFRRVGPLGGVMDGRTGKVEDLGLYNLKRRIWEGLQVPKFVDGWTR
ncbi:hypothetical protein llap_19028 [Limosa lapponica baueri]|uniref:Uncharacterized protein n=1 Tax=Limosa lapponica baueri TaxID=1758121 RepID=A0A2I0TA46_LIMLA|nr:hypothetical protein llap_19028 [Limosa lapponica baueri]